MNTKQIRQTILDLAIRGELVHQDPTDEPASVLLESIRAEKEQLIKDKKSKYCYISFSPNLWHYFCGFCKIPKSISQTELPVETCPPHVRYVR